MHYNFPIYPGTVLPRDCGYKILSSLSAKFPWLHGQTDIQIAPVRGTTVKEDGRLMRTDAHSVLHIRGITEEQARVIGGNWFPIDGQVMAVGKGSLMPTKPSSYLVSRRVVFPGLFDDMEVLAKALQETGVGVQGRAGKRNTIEIKGRHYIGFPVHLFDISDDDSIRIQETGIGKYTSMGCGVFYPGRGQ